MCFSIIASILILNSVFFSHYTPLVLLWQTLLNEGNVAIVRCRNKIFLSWADFSGIETIGSIGGIVLLFGSRCVVRGVWGLQHA